MAAVVQTREMFKLQVMEEVLIEDAENARVRRSLAQIRQTMETKKQI